jgi:hypothetical protein
MSLFTTPFFSGPVGANTSFPLLLVTNEAGKSLMLYSFPITDLHESTLDPITPRVGYANGNFFLHSMLLTFRSSAINTATYFPGSAVLTLNASGVRIHFSPF